MNGYTTVRASDTVGVKALGGCAARHRASVVSETRAAMPLRQLATVVLNASALRRAGGSISRMGCGPT